LESLVQKTIG